MTIAIIRKELHHLIDVADEEKLKALHLLLEDNSSGHNYTDEELKKFYGILHQYENGDMQVFSVEDAHKRIRSKAADNNGK